MLSWYEGVMNSCLSLCSAFLTSHSSDPVHTSWADGWGFQEVDQWLLHVSCSQQLKWARQAYAWQLTNVGFTRGLTNFTAMSKTVPTPMTATLVPLNHQWATESKACSPILQPFLNITRRKCMWEHTWIRHHLVYSNVSFPAVMVILQCVLHVRKDKCGNNPNQILQKLPEFWGELVSAVCDVK